MIVHGDPHALEKIVLNLLGNAVKFTETGGTVQLSTESSGASARIIVRDDGIGIGSGDLPTYSTASAKPTAPPPAVIKALGWDWRWRRNWWKNKAAAFAPKAAPAPARP